MSEAKWNRPWVTRFKCNKVARKGKNLGLGT